MPQLINLELLKNPANWLVVGSMVLVGTMGYHLVKSQFSAAQKGEKK